LITIISIFKGLLGEVFGKSNHFGRLGCPVSKCRKDFLVPYISGRGKLWPSLADIGFRRGAAFKILVANRSLDFLQYVSKGRRAASKMRMFVWVKVKQLVTHRKMRVPIELSLLRVAVFGWKTSAL
jgi:hypothetical protein